ncbi:hypothetical protein [Nitrospina gracilis]|uniref:hypothetical protein n=1 Tax=Nitrospina gracilis TaxID=35801 RepID=UPI001F413B12|nr:hypothetical protein [Nitrospina gracilis]MCF8721437.1 hypothetical protein [Nitrospina gracilis Nb-211]
MNTIRKNSAIMILCALILASAGTASAGETRVGGYEWMHGPNSTVLLKPGWVTSCQNDFIIENSSSTRARVQVDLGIEKFRTDSITSNGKRLYSMRESLSFAKQLGKTVHMDDVALVRNESKEAAVRVHC